VDASVGSRPGKNLELQDGWQHEVFAGEFEGFAAMDLCEQQQSVQDMPSLRLGRFDVVVRHIHAPVVVLELKSLQTSGGRKGARGFSLTRATLGVHLLSDLPGKMACADAQRAGDIAK